MLVNDYFLMNYRLARAVHFEGRSLSFESGICRDLVDMSPHVIEAQIRMFLIQPEIRVSHKDV